MDPNIYLNAIVFYRLAQRDQKQKAVPEPEFRRFELTYLTGSAIMHKKQAVPEWRGRMYLTPSRRKCRPKRPLSSSSYSP
jgi:hypothetical protein